MRGWRKGFRRIAAANTERCVLIDADQAEARVAASILHAVEDAAVTAPAPRENPHLIGHDAAERAILDALGGAGCIMPG